jgi:hypothetical protein
VRNGTDEPLAFPQRGRLGRRAPRSGHNTDLTDLAQRNGLAAHEPTCGAGPPEKIDVAKLRIRQHKLPLRE